MSSTETTKPVPSNVPAVVDTKGNEVAANPAALQYGGQLITELATRTFDDGSTVANLDKVSAWFTEAEAIVDRWVEGSRMVVGATADIAAVTMDVRQNVKNRNGEIDWAGNTDAYSVAYGDRIDSILRQKHHFTKREVQTFQAAVRKWIEENEYTKVRMAQYALSATNGVKSTGKAVVDSDGNTVQNYSDGSAVITTPAGKTNVVLSEKVAEAVNESAAKQTSKSGNILRGFEGTTDDPFVTGGQKVGVRASTTRDTSDTGDGVDASANTPGSFWNKIRSELNKRNKNGVSHLTALQKVREGRWTMSVLATSIVGVPGEPIPGNITDRAKVRQEVQKMIAVLTALDTALDNKNEIGKETLFGKGNLWDTEKDAV